MVKGTAINGNSDKGGRANAPTAPETKAMARLRQPQDRMIPSMSEARELARRMMAESATLKLSPLLIGRIVIADHSPNAVSCSTRTPESPKVKSTREIRSREPRAWQPNGHTPLLGEPGQTRPNQTSKRK